MASKGAYVTGTDGTDFQHRQRVVSTHSTSAMSKHYLKISFYLHFLLYLLIVLKLSEDILDRMDIFILELQELEIPKPDLWEWFYGISYLFTLLGLRAIKKNSFVMIKYYLLSIMLFAFTPIIWAQYKYLFDFIKFINERDLSTIQFVWMNLPIAVIFEAFAIIALQVHLFQLYYAYKLYKLWKPYAQRRNQHQHQQQQQQQQTNQNGERIMNNNSTNNINNNMNTKKSN